MKPSDEDATSALWRDERRKHPRIARFDVPNARENRGSYADDPHRLRNPVAPVERRRCRGHLRHLRPVDADVLQTDLRSALTGPAGSDLCTALKMELAQLGAA